MERQQQQQQQQQQGEELRELGSKLDPPPPSKDTLLKLLKQASAILSDLDQSPPPQILESMQPFFKAIVKPHLLKHLDKDVQLIVASCLCEITRITAPEAPYSDDILKDVFRLIVTTFSALNEITGPAFAKRVIILETLARYRSCVVMLDLECDDLVNELFRTFFAVARDDHPENVFTSMENIMYVLLDESEEISEELLLILLSTLGRSIKGVSEAARKLAMNVIESCAAKLEPVVKQFLISSMSEDGPSNCRIDYHGVIYDLYRCSPQILSGIIPYITGELLNDQSEARIRAVNLVGELFAIPTSVIPEAFQPIFVEFLKRLTDRVVEVRMTVLDFVKKCLLSNPSRPEAPQIFAALCDRLLDYDENVRKQVVAVVCDVACFKLDSVPIETTKLVAERLRDKFLLVKRYTLDRLAEIYRLYSVKCKEGCAFEYDWIPGKILRCFYDKDFRSDAIESVLCGALFPPEFAVKDVVNHWIRILVGLDKVEVKALEKILEQKQRLQQEMQKYLALKQTYKDDDATDATDNQKKVILLFRVMSRFFVDPAKAEEGFLALDQVKDANIWRILPALLDPTTSFHQARASQDELLEILGEKHRIFDFMNVLSVKCSYMLFSKDHVKEILLELAVQKSVGNQETCLSCANMLVILASYSPLLFVGSEEDLLHLLEDDNEIVKEGILHVLARAGGTIREKLATSSSSVDLMLERLCLEGTRRQAKYAVHALAAITKDDGLRSLSVLCKRLVDMMEEKAHLPTVLQSLGCIAQTAMAVFETRETEIVNFIKSKILELTHKGQDKSKARWRDESELCQLKIFGIKTLVKSYLPVKDAHLRGGIDSLIQILRNMLSFGEISRELESSPVDKAHLKVASAKAILRLARYWENKIPVDVFHLALRTVEINYRQARKLFLSKVHQYIKDRVLDVKYACAFLIDIFGSKHAELDEDKHNLADVVHMCRQMKARQHSLQSDGNSQLSYPEYMLPFLVHALAHHPMCPSFNQCRDVRAVEPLYRILHLFFSIILHGDGDTISDVNDADKGKDIIPTVVYILQCIKQSEDVVDPLKSKNSYAISELGLLVVKHLTRKPCDNQGVIDSVSLPCILYKPSDIKEDAVAEAGDLCTWLVEESVSAHFESLALDANGAVHLKIPQDEILEDIEIEGNEMPLGKLIKRIKSQKNKSKAVVKENSLSADTKNDVDILDVVRDINLDNMGLSSNIESGNDHGNHSTPISRGENQTKKRKISDSKSTPIPKRKRSISARNPSRHSFSQSAGKDSIKATSESPFLGQEENKASQPDLLAFPSKKKVNGRGSKRSKTDESQDVEETSIDDRKKAKLAESIKNNSASNDNSTAVSLKKQKRRSVSGLAKCTSNEAAGHTTDLIDCRINIWWPLDKRFYQGVVKSYDPDKKKHVVLYDDGDVEVLRLDKERWELVDDGSRSKKTANTMKSPSKQILPSKTDKKSKVSEESGDKESNKRSSGGKGKKSQRKNLTPRRKAITKGKISNSDEVKSRSDVSNAGPSESSDLDEIESGEHNGDRVDEVPESRACDVEKKSDTAGGYGGSSGTDTEESNSSPERGEADSPEDSLDSGLRKTREPNTSVENRNDSSEHECEEAKDNDTLEKSRACDVEDEDAEDEDEPLSTWKRGLGKSKKPT
ncbi:sister chromatid cohesion protein PDS5 homolog A isoform X2 [Silene latifolia]|uniref:sister chromatid cohesion protein PDS5 homolog A isoform X2 n=1 Tax=Silene latifolia TaxID=37657 RepID=UPI003D787020